MDPDAPQPQPREPAVPPEAPDENAPVIAPPSEQAPQMPQTDVPEFVGQIRIDETLEMK